MKIAAIIAEYNPFHNGHQYHIEETKKQTGADYVIAVMSGDFVQRGAPAFLDKYDRARAALSGGCDLVLELPVVYSTATAELFASGAVLLLDRLGLCDFLSFGSEDGSLNTLDSLSDILLEEPVEFQELLRSYLKNGLSFPAAREKALTQYCSSFSSTDMGDILKGANNILGLEYVKALKKIHSSIRPFTIKRKAAGYHDEHIYESISSASAIRKHVLEKGTTAELTGSLPDETLHQISKQASRSYGFPDFDSLTPYLHQALLGQPNPELFSDWDTELANKVSHLSWSSLGYEELADRLKSRNITHSRIHRALLHLILGIKKEDFDLHFKQNPIPYARILGFRKESSKLIRVLHKHSSIPLITKPADILKTISADDLWFWEKDLAASRLYQSIQFCQCNLLLPSAYERSPVITD